jgi:hypothetical protein
MKAPKTWHIEEEIRDPKDSVLIAIREADMLGEPRPGSMIGACSKCNEPVLVAPSSPECATLICNQCVTNFMAAQAEKGDKPQFTITTKQLKETGMEPDEAAWKFSYLLETYK